MRRLNERLERLINEDIFVTSQPTDVVNLIKNKPKEYRVMYDASLNIYILSSSFKYTHYELLEYVIAEGWYYSRDEYINGMGSFQNYYSLGAEGGIDFKGNKIEPFLFAFVFSPTKKGTELGADGYDKEYEYDFGIIDTRSFNLEDIPIFPLLGEPITIVKVGEKKMKQNENASFSQLGPAPITVGKNNIPNDPRVQKRGTNRNVQAPFPPRSSHYKLFEKALRFLRTNEDKYLECLRDIKRKGLLEEFVDFAIEEGYVSSRKSLKLKLLNESIEIPIKNEGLLEIPEDKKFWELPISHFKTLIKKNGYAKIIKALTNLKIWNKNKDPKISREAEKLMNKLQKEYKKDESLIQNLKRILDEVFDEMDAQRQQYEEKHTWEIRFEGVFDAIIKQNGKSFIVNDIHLFGEGTILAEWEDDPYGTASSDYGPYSELVADESTLEPSFYLLSDEEEEKYPGAVVDVVLTQKKIEWEYI